MRIKRSLVMMLAVLGFAAGWVASEDVKEVIAQSCPMISFATVDDATATDPAAAVVGCTCDDMLTSLFLADTSDWSAPPADCTDVASLFHYVIMTSTEEPLVNPVSCLSPTCQSQGQSGIINDVGGDNDEVWTFGDWTSSG